MSPVWLIVIFLAATVVAVYIAAKSRAKKMGTGVAEEFAGVCAALLESQAKKQRNKNRILELLKTRPEIDNATIRAELKVSRTSAGRYLDELQSAGAIEQIGTTGQSVTYRLKV